MNDCQKGTPFRGVTTFFSKSVPAQLRTRGNPFAGALTRDECGVGIWRIAIRDPGKELWLLLVGSGRNFQGARLHPFSPNIGSEEFSLVQWL